MLTIGPSRPPITPWRSPVAALPKTSQSDASNAQSSWLSRLKPPDVIYEHGNPLQCDPDDTMRPFGQIFGGGTDNGSNGCGIKGPLSWVPDWIAGIDLYQACMNHDAKSDALFERSDKRLGDVITTQAGFFRDILEAGRNSPLGTLGGLGVAVPYTAAVSTVALGQWGVNRGLDGVDWIREQGSKASDWLQEGASSLWKGVQSTASGLWDSVKGGVGGLFGSLFG